LEPISIIVLAGGASQRMGVNKALLTFDGQTLIERVVHTLRPLADDVVIISNTPELYANLRVRQASDVFVGAGPLAGLHAGLQAANEAWSFLVACDMPLVDQRLVRYMSLLTLGHDAVVPCAARQAEPLHALYHKACLPHIERRLMEGERRMISFFSDVHVRFVEPDEWSVIDPDGHSFLNANTPEDWQRLQTLLSAHQGRGP